LKPCGQAATGALRMACRHCGTYASLSLLIVSQKEHGLVDLEDPGRIGISSCVISADPPWMASLRLLIIPSYVAVDPFADDYGSGRPCAKRNPADLCLQGGWVAPLLICTAKIWLVHLALRQRRRYRRHPGREAEAVENLLDGLRRVDR